MQSFDLSGHGFELASGLSNSGNLQVCNVSVQFVGSLQIAGIWQETNLDGLNMLEGGKWEIGWKGLESGKVYTYKSFKVKMRNAVVLETSSLQCL